MKEFRAEIEIDMPAARVWQHLTDFASYADGPPFIYRAVGETAVGARLKLWLRLHDGLCMKVQATVVRVRVEQELMIRRKSKQAIGGALPAVRYALPVPSSFSGKAVTPLHSCQKPRRT